MSDADAARALHSYWHMCMSLFGNNRQQTVVGTQYLFVMLMT